MNRIEKILIVAFSLISIIFLSVGGIYFYRYQNQMSKDIFSEQEKIAKLTSNALDLYFDKLKYAIEVTSASKTFEYENSRHEDGIRFLKTNDYTLKPITRSNDRVWNYFKGLPLSYNGKSVATERRTLARDILSNYQDIHYVFEMNINGDLVFLEPFEIQKKVTSFNYGFRDYLKLVKLSNSTSISEGYISHDKNRTHIITVATPIRDINGKIKKVFAASISAKTIHDRVLSSIITQIDPEKNYRISLVDKHGHIVANSTNLENYLPKMGTTDDLNDSGNIRHYKIFNQVGWTEDIFEKKNVWERRTKSWTLQTKDILTDNYVNKDQTRVFGTLSPISIYNDNAFNWGVLVETPMDKYNQERLVTLIVFVISFILIIFLLFLVYKKTLKEYQKIESDVRRAENNIKQLAKKVEHDITSPLTSIGYLFENIKPKLEEDERLIAMHSLERINDIFLTLSPERIEKAEKNNSLSVEILFPLINRVVSEKRLELNSQEGIQLKLANHLKYGVFTAINKSHLARTISNLINNSVESKQNKSSLIVSISLTSNDKTCCIEIRDNGCGIDEKNIKDIFDYGHSYNKPKGKGIGLSQARDHINEAGGTLHLTSKVGFGTTINITLPLAKEPSWFQKSLIFSTEKLCIIDDDESIHHLWATKLTNHELQIVNIKSSIEFDKWAARSNLSEYYFLFDLELLGSNLSGLDLIRKYNIANRSTLVSSHYNDTEVQRESSDVSVKLIPKDLASDIPVEFSKNKKVVLIDNDELIHRTWNRELNKNNYKLTSFYSVEDFLKESGSFEFDTPIYIDSDLGEGFKGEILSEGIFKAGFGSLYITSGYNKDSFKKPDWIKMIIGKKPDFLTSPL